jgi:hypothetical protein
MWDGILAGVAVSTLTGGMALGVLHWSYDRGNQVFMVAFMGGMLVRLVLVIALSALILSFTAVDKVSYIASLLVVYLLFLGLEIYYALIKNAVKADTREKAENEK